MEFSESLRNLRLTAISTCVGPAGTLKFFSGKAPASCEDDDRPDDLLAEITLPARPFTDARDAIIAGQWTGVASGVGRIGHFRLSDQSGRTHLQGTVSAPGGGGDMEVSDTIVVPEQRLEVRFAIVGANGAPTTATDKRATTSIDDDDVVDMLDVVADGVRLKFDRPLDDNIVRDGGSVSADGTPNGGLMRKALGTSRRR